MTTGKTSNTAGDPAVIGAFDSLIAELASGSCQGQPVVEWDAYPSEDGAGVLVAVQFGDPASGGLLGNRVVAAFSVAALGLSAPVPALSTVLGAARDARAARLAADAATAEGLPNAAVLAVQATAALAEAQALLAKVTPGAARLAQQELGG